MPKPLPPSALHKENNHVRTDLQKRVDFLLQVKVIVYNDMYELGDSGADTEEIDNLATSPTHSDHSDDDQMDAAAPITIADIDDASDSDDGDYIPDADAREVPHTRIGRLARRNEVVVKGLGPILDATTMNTLTLRYGRTIQKHS